MILIFLLVHIFSAPSREKLLSQWIRSYALCPFRQLIMFAHQVVIFSPARTASQQGSGKVGKWKINFMSTQKYVSVYLPFLFSIKKLAWFTNISLFLASTKFSNTLYSNYNIQTHLPYPPPEVNKKKQRKPERYKFNYEVWPQQVVR